MRAIGRNIVAATFAVTLVVSPADAGLYRQADRSRRSAYQAAVVTATRNEKRA